MLQFDRKIQLLVFDYFLVKILWLLLTYVKSKQILRFDGKFELLQFDNFSRENSSLTY